MTSIPNSKACRKMSLTQLLWLVFTKATTGLPILCNNQNKILAKSSEEENRFVDMITLK